MRLSAIAAVVALSSMTVAAPGSKEVPKKEDPGLIGEWEMVDAKNGVEKVGQGQPVRVYRFDADGTFQGFENGKKDGEPGKFKHDPNVDPPTLDFNSPSPGPKQPLVPGIYRVDRDRLTICIPYPGGNPRPTVFDAQPGSRRILFEFKRLKPKD
jgi:uncharacterized protein (TIGR03067 family)